MKIKPTSEKAKSASKVSSRSHLGEQVPQLRFPGFNGEWNCLKLNDFAERVTRKNGSTSDIPLTISAQHGLIDQRTFFSKAVASADMSGYYLLKNGEFAYNRSSSGEFPFGSIKRLDQYKAGAVSTLYICFGLRDQSPVSDFIKWYFDSSKWHREAGLICAEGARNHGLLNVPTVGFFNTMHHIPADKNEQEKIAAFLSLVDRRLTAQRRLVELLKKHKRGLVQDLFTSELSKLPRLRFAGFKDAWTIRSFDEVFSFLKNNILPRSEMTTAGGMIRNVHYGDVLIKYGDVLDCNRDQIPFLVSDKQSDDYRLLQDGDVVIADTAEDEAVGKTVELVGVANKLIESGLHTIACRPTISFAPRFLGYYLNSTAYRRQLLPLMQGIKVLSLSKSQLGKTQLLFPPDINEQKRIAELLTGIDAHIAMAQSHLDKMQSLKTGFLQQLFV